MKKIYVIMLLCVPLLLFLGFRTSKAIGVSGLVAQQAQGPSYHLETDHISMKDLGKLLERLGKEIQQKGQVTIGGDSYPVTDYGYLEFHVSPRQEGTSIQFELSTHKGLPTKKGKETRTTYISYERGNMRVTPAEFAKILARFGKTLASKGTFIIDDHSVAFEGTASVVQQLMEHTRQRGGRPPCSFTFDVMFGQKDFPVPQDEAEDPTALRPEERGWIKELAKKEITGADQKAVAKLFDSLSRDLKAGRVRVGDQDLPAGENIMCGLSHLIAMDGTSHRIRVGFQFGEVTPRKRPTGPRYGEEFFDAPMKKVGALLKRLGTEILESGTFKLGETEFKVKERATYEISASEGGFSIGLGYTEPPKKK